MTFNGTMIKLDRFYLKRGFVVCDVWKGSGTVVLMMVSCVNCRWDSSGGECYRCRKEGRPIITLIILRDLVYNPQLNMTTRCEEEDRGAQT